MYGAPLGAWMKRSSGNLVSSSKFSGDLVSSRKSSGDLVITTQ